MTTEATKPSGASTWTRTSSAVLLGLLLGALGLVSIIRNAGWSEPDDGATWGAAQGSVVLLEVRPGGPADAAGLRPGDLLAAIDGDPVRSTTSARNRLWEGDRSTPRAYRVVRNGRAFDARIRPDSIRGPEKTLYPYLAIVGFFFLCTGCYALLRFPGGRLLAPFLLLCVSLFALLALSDTSRAEGWDWVLFWGDRVGRLLAPAAFLHFVVVFVRRPPVRAVLLAGAAYVTAGTLGAWNVLLVGFGRAGVVQDPVGLIALKDRVELGAMAVFFLGGMTLLAGGALTETSRSQRRQLRWMMWGTVLGLGPFTLLYMAPVALGLTPPPWAPATALPMIVLPLAFVSALLRYRLSDLELFLKRGVEALSVVFFTLATYELLSLIMGRTLGVWLGSPTYTVTALAVVATAILYPRIRGLTRSTVDRAFYRGKYNFRRTLVSFGRELNSELDLDTLVRKIENRVRQTLDLETVALYLYDDRTGRFIRSGAGSTGPAELEAEPSMLERVTGVSYLDIEDLAVGSGALQALASAGLTTLFPMRTKGEVRAQLAVGRRPDGEPLNSEDIEMLVALSAQAASAIEAARLLRQLTEQISEVERLRSTNENILESSRVGILVVDGEGRVQNCNRAMEALTGVPRSGAEGKLVSELYCLPLVREIEQLIARALSGKEATPRAYRSSVTNGRGERVRVNLALSPLGTGGTGGRAADRAQGWVITVDDVTEQVALEERLIRQDRLAAIGLLASGVAHEVNTPLTGISSYAQILLEEMDPSDPRFELLRKIERQTVRASSIANSLLNFTRDGGEGSIDRVDVSEIVDEALTLFEPQLARGRVHLEKSVEGGLPRISAHRGKLEQVLLNLLLNARDAIGEEGTIRISARRAADRLIVEVADDGCGIAEENLGRVFDPFFTTKERGRGTGLGLSLSYNIIKEYRGEITVQSRPGHGTVFTIELPLDRRWVAGAQR